MNNIFLHQLAEAKQLFEIVADERELLPEARMILFGYSSFY